MRLRLKAEDVTAALRRCRQQCEAAGGTLHADALAAELGISYEQLAAAADGCGASRAVAAAVRHALQQCTAAVVAAALADEPKTHPMWMFYLRNRAGFVDKGEARDLKTAVGSVIFVGEERI